MKKSNMIVGSVAAVLLGVVLVCLFAFKERPSWRADREEQRAPITKQRAIGDMKAFAERCGQVEELVVQSPANIKGETLVSDSSSFEMLPQGDVAIDTLFENGGKKLTFKVAGQKNAQTPYYYLQLLLPRVQKISASHVNLKVTSYRLPQLQLLLSGESGCQLYTPLSVPALSASITDLSALRYAPPDTAGNISIKVSGNGFLSMPKRTAKALQQKGSITLQDNGIVQ
jgi:hypothetical protein